MKWWPWGSAERRESGYTSTLVQMAIDRAKGTSGASAGATAALEACSGAVARAFAAADVSGGTFARAALTPACLSFIGRTIIRRGEAVLAIDAGAPCGSSRRARGTCKARLTSRHGPTARTCPHRPPS